MNDADKQLIINYLAGDDRSFESLVRRHLKPVYNFLARFTGGRETDDLVQETFLRAWKNLNRFDIERDFRVWLFTIARNVGIDWLRKNKRHVTVSLDQEDDDDIPLAEKIGDSAPRAEELTDLALQKDDVREIIAGLSPHYQMVLSMRYEEDLTFQDISDILGVSINTVKSRYRRAIAIIKKRAGEIELKARGQNKAGAKMDDAPK
jgi:RNA polymerase sigma-70 factor (ECF subfamily)